MLKSMSKVIVLSAMNGKTNNNCVELAQNLLIKGSIIGLPTDTIYGLAALAQNDSAIHKLYEIKSRNSDKPLAICVSDIEDMSKWCQMTVSSDLLRDLLPGAVTLVFERSSNLNPRLNPNTDLVGIRIPDYNFIRSLCRVCGPLALTSANISSQSSCLNVEEFKDLWPHLGAVFDGGPLGQSDTQRLGSTVVDLSVKGFFKIIRDGCALNQTISILQHKYKLNRIY